MPTHDEDSVLSRATTHTRDSNDTTSSATRFALDAEDADPILVYRWEQGIGKSSQRQLCDDLDHYQGLRVTKKAIPKRAAYVDIRRHDLYLPYEQEQYKRYPNYDSSLASVKIPQSVYWSRMLFGSYDKLYIVSPEISPNSSATTSAVESRNDSPFIPTSSYYSETREGAGEFRI